MVTGTGRVYLKYMKKKNTKGVQRFTFTVIAFCRMPLSRLTYTYTAKIYQTCPSLFTGICAKVNKVQGQNPGCGSTKSDKSIKSDTQKD